MQNELNWREQVKRVAADNLSGASEVARLCAEALIAYTEQEQPESIEAVRSALAQSAATILHTQASMAPVVRILNDAMVAVSEASAVRSALDQLRRVAHESIALVEQASFLVMEAALSLLSPGSSVVTISYSAAVANTLIQATQQGYDLEVMCLESRPNFEGRALASHLGEHGVRVSLAVDAAVFQALQEADIALIGADSLAEAGVINKIGTAAMAACGQVLSVPLYVIADQSKIWPAELGIPPNPLHPPDEVWEQPSAGVNVRNRYFDLTPWEMITAVVTERGVQDGMEIVEASRLIRVDESIRAFLKRPAR